MIQKVKKGFTLVELVIVIAVIAILAAVLLPTFAGVINRARSNERLQMATNARKEYFSSNEQFDTVEDMNGLIISVKQGTNDWYYYIITNGELVEVTEKCTPDNNDSKKLTYTDTSAINYTEIELNENQVSHSTDKIKIYAVAPAGPVYTVDGGGAVTIGSTILFGSYPQSKVADNDVLTELGAGTNNQEKTVTSGKYVYVGTGSNQGWYKYEPIKWTVLNIEEGKALLLSEKILYASLFNQNESDGNNYSTSYVRSHLTTSNENDGIDSFYETAFTAEEKTHINTDNHTYGVNGDAIFLLTKDNILDLLDEEGANKRQSTDVAKSGGVWTDDSTNNGCWWTSTVYGNTTDVVYYSHFSDSTNFVSNTYVNANHNGVCPALYITL